MIKIIYLDWNVIKYLKTPRKTEKEKKLDLELAEKINALRNKKSIFIPYSISHLNDLYISDTEGNEAFIREDLDFLNHITNGKMIVCENDNFQIESEDAHQAYQIRKMDIIRENEMYKKASVEAIGRRDIDLSKMNSDNLMYLILKKHNGVLNNDSFKEFAEFMRDHILDNKDVYKKFREEIKDVKKNLEANSSKEEIEASGLNYVMKFVDSLECNKEDELCNVWTDIVYDFLKLNKRDMSKREIILNSYGLLDLHPLFSEKMKGKNKADNIVRDAGHITYTCYSNVFVSENAGTLKKAKFINKVHNLSSIVCNEAEFLKLGF